MNKHIKNPFKVGKVYTREQLLKHFGKLDGLDDEWYLPHSKSLTLRTWLIKKMVEEGYGGSSLNIERVCLPPLNDDSEGHFHPMSRDDFFDHLVVGDVITAPSLLYKSERLAYTFFLTDKGWKLNNEEETMACNRTLSEIDKYDILDEQLDLSTMTSETVEWFNEVNIKTLRHFLYYPRACIPSDHNDDIGLLEEQYNIENLRTLINIVICDDVHFNKQLINQARIGYGISTTTVTQIKTDLYMVLIIESVNQIPSRCYSVFLYVIEEATFINPHADIRLDHLKHKDSKCFMFNTLYSAMEAVQILKNPNSPKEVSIESVLDNYKNDSRFMRKFF